MWARILSVVAALSLTFMVFAFAESARGDPLVRTASSPWTDPDPQEAAAMLKEMKAALGREFTYTTTGPWLIATDMDKEGTESITKWTIGVYAAGIQRQLFTKAAVSKPLKVFLFKDGESYTKWNQKLFNEKPSTPFGYFSRARRALVMNIGTGGGTLTHEMTHAMAEADFPDIPAWLNEGLGSLYEGLDRDASNRVIGVKNWRLRGLLEDIAKAPPRTTAICSG